MRLHHLNCISACPLGGKWLDDESGPLGARARFACHCVLVETAGELVLVDTGFGLRDVRDPHGRLSSALLQLFHPEFREEMTAVRQVQRLGFEPLDVRHVVLTHLDCDHAGGLDDFPAATVHMLRRERDAATGLATALDRMRYRPQQWSTQPNWQVYDSDEGEGWFGFARVSGLQGLPPEILMIPLVGHTYGHAGVALQTDEGWYLHAGDAYFFHREMDPVHPYCTPGLRAYQTLMEKDRSARLANQDRLRALRRDHGDEVEVFCSHDTREFERLAGRSATVPVPAMPLHLAPDLAPV